MASELIDFKVLIGGLKFARIRVNSRAFNYFFFNGRIL
jgi:hypothetical protein